jgi:hypothetical protein
MRTLGLEGVRRVKKVRTTIPDKDGKGSVERLATGSTHEPRLTTDQMV